MRTCVLLSLLVLALTANVYGQDPGIQTALEKHKNELLKIDKDFEAAKAKRDKAQAAAKKALIDAFQAAIRRATKKGDLAAANALQEKLKSLEDESADPDELLVVDDPKKAEPAAKATIKDSKRLPKNACFCSMLGIYRLNNNNYYPFVNLSLPKSDLWTDHIKDQLRGKISLFDIAYEGRASFEVPKDGVYSVIVKEATVKIDEQDTGGSGDITLSKGIHDLALAASGNGMSVCTIKIRDKQSGDEIQLFNSWQTIQQFLQTPVQGVKVTELSGWQPTDLNRVNVGKKK